MEYVMLESVEELDVQTIQSLIRRHKMKELPRIKRLRNYYEGRHDILNRTFPDPSKPNNKVVNNYCKLITDVTHGYFIGTPVRYTSIDETGLMYLQDTLSINNEQAHNSILAKNASIFGRAFELLYMDERADIKFAVIDNEEVFPIYSTTVNPNIIAVVRYYTIKSYVDTKDDVKKVEVYTDKAIRYYTDNGSLRLDTEVQHYFGKVPVNVYYNNDEELGDFEQVIPLVDAYNLSVSDYANQMEYFNDAYLVIKGAMDSEPEEFANMKQNRLLLLPEEADANFLIKGSDTAGIEAYNNRLKSDIHKFSYVPDISSESFNTQISGVALSFKFNSLEQVCKSKERLFKQSLDKRIEMIFNILAIKGIHIDANLIEATFSRSLPVNNAEYVTLVKDLYGMVSKETLLAQLPFIEDPQAELNKIEAEENPDPYAVEEAVFNQQEMPME